MQVLDLIGYRFCKLLVLKRDSSDKHGNARWLCRCDCGNEKIIVGLYLTSGKTKSCGCLHKEYLNKRKRKNNTYNLTSYNYGVGFSEDGEEFYFDLEDYEKIKDNYWFLQKNGYVVSRVIGKIVRLHRLIMNVDDNVIIDHKNNKRNDNRKTNLRKSNNQTNQINRSYNKNNKLKIKGVSLSKNGEKFIARIMVNGKSIHLGCFDNIEDAITARENAEEKYFGEFSYKKNNT